MLNFVELSKMRSLELLTLLQETPRKARGVTPFLFHLGSHTYLGNKVCGKKFLDYQRGLDVKLSAKVSP